ncbi:granzyme G [Clupea harengus]|uniref:Granzyme G n=1 Tax=Clupea harengus TaxID=7950 RepID=A0A6P3VP16_CLUHA|nr:granzyme G [Clupea harengus]
MHTLSSPLLVLLVILLKQHTCRAEGIINGSTAADKAMQYMASVQINGKHVCGGFVIKPNFVLTAAHCNARGKMSVVLGAHNLHKTAKNKRFYIKNQDKLIPELYKGFETGNDIMLLKLSGKIGKGVKTVQIPSSNKMKMKNSTKCLVAGWGKTGSKNEVSNQLQVAHVQVVGLQDCQTAWNQNGIKTELPESVMCAKGFNRNGPSKGDSGGPLVCNGMALGIVSFNLNERYKQIIPAVYTQISKFLPWIKSKM